MKKLFALLAVFALAFSFGVFASNHEGEVSTTTGTVVTETTVEVSTGEVAVETAVTTEVATEIEASTGEVVVTYVAEDVVRVESGLVAVELQSAIDYLYANGLTMFATEETFMGDSSLRRDEAAAFFARFARDVLGMEVNAEAEGCEFSDMDQAHKDLTDEVLAACQLGLMKGSNGKFMPRATLTNAQALTVLVRLIDGEKEEVAGNWAANYYAFAKEAGLTVSLHADMEEHLSMSISRADVAKLIEAGAVYKSQHRGDPHENMNGEQVEMEVETETEVVVETGSVQE